MSLKLFWVPLFLLLPPIAAYTQQIPLRNYTMRDGLSHSNVFRIMQDERGFMIFSTGFGISVFDSKVFHNYTRREGLPHNTVLSAAPYGAHEEVLSTYGGGLALLADGGVLKFPLPIGEMPTNVVCAAEYRQRLWLIGQHVAYRLYYIQSGTSHLIDMPDGKGGQVIFLKLITQGNNLLVAAADGLYRIGAHGEIVRLYSSLVSSTVIDVQNGKDGSYWIAQKDKLLCIKDGRLLRQYPFTGMSSITDLLCDHSGNIWVGTLGNGLYCYSVQYARIIHFSDLINMPKVIINDLFEDKDGSLWIATYGKGVYRMDGMEVMNYAPQRGLMNVYCLALARLNDREVVTGSIGTLSIYDGFRLKHIPSVNIQPDDYIYFIKKRGAELLIGTAHMLIAKSILPPYSERLITSKGAAIGCISYFEDSRGRRWAGSFGQLYQIIRDDLVIQPLPGANRINAIGEDNEHNLWLGTDSGFVVSDGRTFRPLPLSYLPLDTRVNSIYKDRRGRLWCATSEGLLLKEGKIMVRFSTEEGLTHNKCNTITEDSAGTIWVGTINGISRIDVNALNARDYRAQIYPNEVLTLFPFQGTLLLGLVDGLSVMRNPTLNKEFPPPLYLTSIRTGTRTLPVSTEINLPYWDNKLSVDFIAISYRNADLVGYRYKLEGLDQNWHYTSGNSLVLSELPYGSYTLILSARQNSGAWSQDTRLHIHVAMPFWKTWWAILTSSLLAFVIIFLMARWLALRRARARHNQLANYNKIAYLKHQALSALINPHFIFNCMNSIQHFLHSNDNDAANEYLGDFATLIRMIMEHSQQAFISLEDEVERLRLYMSLEQLRFGTDLRYEFTIDPTIDLMEVRVPNMILQPYIENAIIHGIVPKGSPGFISIRFTYCDTDDLEVIIEDDGVGIKDEVQTERLRNPLGMSLTEERLQLLQDLLRQRYTVEIISKPSSNSQQGTLVRLRLPMQPDEGLLQRKEAESLNKP